MVHMLIRYPSRLLGRTLELHALFPKPQSLLAEQTAQHAPGEGKCLWFFHGVGDDPQAVLCHTDLAALCDTLGLIVLLPEADNSFCLDLEASMRYRSYLTEELMPFAAETLRLPEGRENTLIGGISMGGYGALSIALEQPERFSRVICLSGALDLKAAARYSRIVEIPLAAALREKNALSAREDWDLLRQMDALAERGAQPPKLWLSCSERDMVYASNLRAAEHAARLGLPAELHTAPGLHDWRYWRENLPAALDWALR